jgi:hypothetical protein
MDSTGKGDVIVVQVLAEDRFSRRDTTSPIGDALRTARSSAGLTARYRQRRGYANSTSA